MYPSVLWEGGAFIPFCDGELLLILDAAVRFLLSLLLFWYKILTHFFPKGRAV